MRLIRQLSNREKIILSFLVLLVTLNGSTILVSSNLNNFSYAFKSMLEDRLVPASEIARIQENLYQNRFALLKGITQLQEKVGRDIARNNQEIDELTLMYAKTYLTPKEADELDEYRKQIEAYRKLESQVLRLIEKDSTQAALNIFMQQSVPAFDKLQHTMHSLENIQLVVGKDLYQDADHTVSIIQLFGYLSIAIALVLTVYMLKVLHFKVK